jgi:two-component system nitrogen regulation response regulator NtrX
MHVWAGNIRELRNVVERLILLATEGQVTVETVQLALPHIASHQLSSSQAAGPGSTAGSGTLAERVQGFEREVILAELKRSHRHITNAAKALGLERSHLYKKAEQLGIDLQALRHEPSDVNGAS